MLKKVNRERSKRIMAIRIEPRLVKVVSTPIESKTRKGEMFRMIADVGTTARPDHWYVNMYKTAGYHDFDHMYAAMCAERGDEIMISGSIRKYPLKGAYGVVIDADETFDISEDDDAMNAGETSTSVIDVPDSEKDVV